MRAIKKRYRTRRVVAVEVEIVKAVTHTVPTVNDPVKSDLNPPKPRDQPQFGTKPPSPQMG